jgi:CRISPR system Cascade subunit CasD
MSVLLLRLAGPMQSWGTQSRFSHRDSGMEPSKSGVIGLLCAALGRQRHEPVDDLAGLKMAVRVDREGRMARDFHTAQAVLRSDLSGTQETVISQRFYLADAEFLVGLEGSDALLGQVNDALHDPVWTLFLGRKSFVPSENIPLGIQNGAAVNLESVLTEYPRRRRYTGEKIDAQKLRLVIETPASQGEPRNDVPVSFSERRFTVRHVTTQFVDIPLGAEEEVPCS